MGVTIHTVFPGGIMGRRENSESDRLQVRLYRERAADNVNTQATWFYARLDGLEGPLELMLTGLDDVYEGQSAHSIDERDKPVVSDDGVNWRRLTSATFDRANATLTLPLEPAGERIWVAMLEPYGLAELAALARVVVSHPFARLGSIGDTVEDRPLPMWSIGREDAPHCVWLLARQHAWEAHTSWCLDGVIQWLLSDAAAAFRERCVVQLLPLMDPDGVVRGGTRVNFHGYDLNRHWHETDPSNPEHARLRPEIAATKAEILAWLEAGRPIDLMLNLHNTQHDVMEAPEPVAQSPLVRALHAKLCAAGYTGELRANSNPPGTVQNGLFSELGIPGALIELGTADLPGWDHLPTADDRVAFGKALGQALSEVL